MNTRRALLAFGASLALGVSLLAPASSALAAGPNTAPTVAGSSTTSSVLAPPDPGDAGPNAVTATEYNDGDTAFQPPGFPGPVEVRASVHYPTALDKGPYPLVVLLHGRHSTCYSGGSAAGGWPCSGGYQTIPSFQGYDYLAKNLASWGYIVVSVSANGINARDASSPDDGMTARGQLVQLHLDKWKTFSTTGGNPFGSLFVGKVDMQNIGTMGHSRGGEGVVRNYQINQELGAPYGIKAVLPLAPVDFHRPVINNVPLSVILPYCDGDVSDLQGAHFYDDARYKVAGDNTAKYMQESLGTNHNHFNTIWTPGEFPAGTWDDSTCSATKLTAPQQRAVGLAYMAGFFRLTLGGETAFKPYFDGTMIDPPSIKTAQVMTEYHAPANARLDVNRFLDDKALTKNDLGGAVTQKKLTPFDLCGGASPQPQHCLPVSGYQQPHTTGGYRPNLSQLRYGWSGKAKMTNVIPGAAKDVSAYAALTLRTARNFNDGRSNPTTPPKMFVILKDGSGSSKRINVAKWSDALFVQPGGSGLPKLVHNTVRIPLSAFSGVDLTNVSSVTYKYKKSGAVVTTDLAFTDHA